MRILDWGWSPQALDRRVGPWTCAAAWVLAAVIFVGLVSLIGGPSPEDATDSTVATTAIARAEFRCAYPHDNPTPTPPLYPLLSGAIAGLTHIAGRVENPGLSLAEVCRHGEDVSAQVSPRGTQRILWLGVSMWLAVLAGFVLLLRASKRGRTGWECVGVLVLACVTPVLDALVFYFHPNDLLAIGLVEAALAAAITRRWIVAGLLVGLACTAHQFAALAAVPLVIGAPPRARARTLMAAVSTVVVVVVVSWVMMGIGAVDAAAGRGATFASTGTLVDVIGLRGNALVVLSRAVPLVCAAAVAIVGRRRVKEALWTPTVAVSMIALCLGFRLVFETSLYGYYLAAAAVFVVAVDAVQGRARPVTAAWLVLVWLVWPFHSISNLEGHLTLAQVVVVGSYLVLVAPAFVRACRAGPVAERPVPSSIAE